MTKHLFLVSVVPLEVVHDMMEKLETRMMSRLSRTDKRVDLTEKRLESSEKKLEVMGEETIANRSLDLYAFADQSERSDYASNLLKAHCVLLTGDSL